MFYTYRLKITYTKILKLVHSNHVLNQVYLYNQKKNQIYFQMTCIYNSYHRIEILIGCFSTITSLQNTFIGHK